MSAGEKKVSTLLRSLCDPSYMDHLDVVLIDSIENEIYFERHPLLINKLLEVFPTKQFLAVTHSSDIKNAISEKYHFNLNKYKEEEWKKFKGI